MTIERKLLSTSPSGDAPNVAEVFSAFLYKAGSAERKVNGIDLSGEGGMVWTKSRTSTSNHRIQDTVRGTSASGHYKNITPNSSGAEGTQGGITTFHNNGYSLDNSSSVTDWNNGSNNYVSWTFRKKEKFFDVLNYTGNGASSRAISHGLGSTPAFIWIKATSGSDHWYCYHTSLGFSKNLKLNTVDPQDSYPPVSATSDTTFTLSGSNNSGTPYVAYLFADNSSELADNQMIKCGIYTGTGASVGATVNLGWEPQFVMVKAATGGGSWAMFDTMRGIPYGSDNVTLFANTTAADQVAANWLELNSTGFKIFNGNYGNGNTNNVNYIYMAIRAPMMKAPEAATDVFKPLARTGTGGTASVTGVGFPFDAVISKPTSNAGNAAMFNRLSGPLNVLLPNNADPETARAGSLTSFDQDGFSVGSDGENLVNANNYTYIYHMLKRAKGFMDVVAYSGNGTAGRTLTHSLGVVPEMIWTKNRNTNGTHWAVYHKGHNGGSSPQNYYTTLNNASGDATDSDLWNNTAPSSTLFTVGANEKVNTNSANFIGYLFATLAGISKVGSYSGNAANNHVINCGFSAGARFVLIKRSDGAGDWFLFDSVRGITSTSNDGILHLNDTNIQRTEAYEIGADAIQPHASGFKLTSNNTINHGEMEYIFYAIA